MPKFDYFANLLKRKKVQFNDCVKFINYEMFNSALSISADDRGWSTDYNLLPVDITVWWTWFWRNRWRDAPRLPRASETGLAGGELNADQQRYTGVWTQSGQKVHLSTGLLNPIKHLWRDLEVSETESAEECKACGIILIDFIWLYLTIKNMKTVLCVIH